MNDAAQVTICGWMRFHSSGEYKILYGLLEAVQGLTKDTRKAPQLIAYTRFCASRQHRPQNWNDRDTKNWKKNKEGRMGDLCLTKGTPETGTAHPTGLV